MCYKPVVSVKSGIAKAVKPPDIQKARKPKPPKAEPSKPKPDSVFAKINPM